MSEEQTTTELEEQIAERVKRLKRKNNHDQLVELAMDAGLEVAGDATKQDIAEALATAELEGEALEENLEEPEEPAPSAPPAEDSIEAAEVTEIQSDPPAPSEPPPPPKPKPYRAPKQVAGAYVPTTAITYVGKGGDVKSAKPTRPVVKENGDTEQVPNVVYDIGAEDLEAFLAMDPPAVAAHFE